MNLALVDTNALSFLFKHDTRARLYLPHLAGTVPGISFMTLAEMHRWSKMRQWGPAQVLRMRAFLAGYTLYWVDPLLCEQWAEVQAVARQQGHPIDNADTWIAATAMLYNLPLITHNPKDFQGVAGLTIITEAP
ncbi:MAG: PIN domain-containing protein [Armatimonadetes bacterium]|nr:PIN domain-containing protein [Armatimonadota bacterium]